MLSNAEHPLHKSALRFHKYTQELYSGPAGQEWFQALFAFGAHPMFQAPVGDPVISAHMHGRSEMAAFLLRLAADTAIPLLPNQTPQTNGSTTKTEPEPVRKTRGRQAKQ